MKRACWVGILLAAACVGNIGDDQAPQQAPTPPSDGTVPEIGMRRLSTHEYDRTIRDLLGDDAVDAAALVPNDIPSPFDNDYQAQTPSRALIEAAETLAREIAARLLQDLPRRDAIVGCVPQSSDDEACFTSLAKRLGRSALRRPLSDAETDELVQLALDFALRDDNFYTGVEVMLRALLQDVEFLYRVEIGSPAAGHPGVFRLNGFELATRMSYLLWGTTPDDALLDLADSGGLDTRQDVVAAAKSMLADDRARVQVDRFHAMWLGYDTLQHAPAIAQAMRAETRALLDRIVFDEHSSWMDLFTSAETFVDDTLATHYGLASPGASPAWMDYSAEGRRGLLSHGSFLSVGHDVGETSPTARGLHILHRLTCQQIPPPPPGVADNFEVGDGDCKSEILKAHSEGSCAACHDAFDGIGFGLEQYDVAGRFRTHEEGKPHCGITGEGELLGVGAFTGPAELGERLVESGKLEACAVEHVYQYAIGRRIEDADRALVERLATSFADSHFRFDELLVALVSSDAFFFRREPAEGDR